MALKITPAIQKRLSQGMNIVEALDDLEMLDKVGKLDNAQIKYFLDYEKYKHAPRAAKLLNDFQKIGRPVGKNIDKKYYSSGVPMTAKQEGDFEGTIKYIQKVNGVTGGVKKIKAEKSALGIPGNTLAVKPQAPTAPTAPPLTTTEQAAAAGVSPGDMLMQEFIDSIGGGIGDKFKGFANKGIKAGNILKGYAGDVESLGNLYTPKTIAQAKALSSGIDFSGELAGLSDAEKQAKALSSGIDFSGELAGLSDAEKQAKALSSGIDFSGELGTFKGLSDEYRGIADKVDPRFATFEQARRANLEAEELKQRGQISNFFSRRGLGGTGAALTAENNTVDAFGRQRDELNAGLGLQQLSRQDQALQSIAALTGQTAGLKTTGFNSQQQGLSTLANIINQGAGLKTTGFNSQQQGLSTLANIINQGAGLKTTGFNSQQQGLGFLAGLESGNQEFGLKKIGTQAGLNTSALDAENLGLSGFTSFLQNLLAPKSLSISEQAANASVSGATAANTLNEDSIKSMLQQWGYSPIGTQSTSTSSDDNSYLGHGA